MLVQAWRQQVTRLPLRCKHLSFCCLAQASVCPIKTGVLTAEMTIRHWGALLNNKRRIKPCQQVLDT